MSLKAAECGLMLPFCIDILRKHGGPAVFGRGLLQAGVSLTQILNIIRHQRCVVTPVGKELLLDAAQTHLMACAVAGLTYTPKSHLMCHMLDRISVEHFPPRARPAHR